LWILANSIILFTTANERAQERERERERGERREERLLLGTPCGFQILQFEMTGLFSSFAAS
jgi:hypothetical protein